MAKKYTVLKQQANWQDLWFYRKAETLYQLTVEFTRRFLPAHGDRTVDQMVQAARSGKQNIVEGSADGVSSSEMEIKLLNVARASIKELQEDYYEDYLATHQLPLWEAGHPRFSTMIGYCSDHNDAGDYSPFFDKWSAEEMANVGYTLCRMTDKMLTSYLKKLEERFVTEGGIKERMTAARIGYRNDQRQQLEQAQREIEMLKAENDRLKQAIAQLQDNQSSPKGQTF